MIARAVTLAAVILAGGAYAHGAGSLEHRVARTPLAQLPCTVEAWRCGGETPLDRDSLAILRVDDYVNRTYVAPDGRTVEVFIAYYDSQRQGDTIHSPLNCLPGSGWQPLSTARINLADVAPVNEMVVQKDLDRQVVVYWYQGRGRVIANEYVNKFWLMADAIRLHRSNGALVRIVAPTAAAAERFAAAIHPRLSPYLP